MTRRSPYQLDKPHTTATRRGGAYYRAIVEASTDLICRFQLDGTLSFVNQAYCRYFQQTRESLLGSPFRPRIPPDDQYLVDRMFAALAPDMGPYTYEHRVVLSSGEVRWQQSTIVAVRDESGAFLEYQAIGRDITEAKSVADELEASRAESDQLRDRLIQAIESIPDGFGLYDAEDRLVVCNNRYRELYDVSSDLVVPGVKFEDLIRASAYRGQIADAVGREEEWVRARLVQHRDPQGTYLQQLGNGRWLQIDERKTSDGGIVGVRTDITERKQAEDSLALFRSLIDRTSDFIEVIDPATGRYLDVNESACVAHGYTREEYLALSIPQLDPQVAEMTWPVVSAEIRKVEHYVLETSHRRKDGSLFPVEVRCTHVMLEREYLLANVRDISERKRSEVALRESEERYKTIFSNAPDALFVVSAEGDNAGEIVTANERAASMHGYSLRELVGMQIAQVDSPEGAKHVPERLRRLAAGERLTFEVEHRRKDGSLFPVEVTAERVMLGGKAHVLAFDRDISARKATEAALRESEERYKTIFESAPDAVYVIAVEGDDAGRIVAANHLAAKLHGCDVDDVIGMSVDEFDSPASAEGRPERLRRILAGERLTFEIVKRRRDGTEFPVEVTAEKVILDGRAHVLAFGRDITQRKHAEAERSKLEAQFVQAQKMESLGVLAGGIAHDFNNLLAVISNYASAIELSLPQESPSRPMVTEIEKVARRAGDLTRQMLAYAGKATYVIETLSLDKLVQEMANLLGSVVSDQAKIELNLSPATIDADATQIRQVLMNLLTNASDALEGNAGTITVCTGERFFDVEQLKSPYLPNDLTAGKYAYFQVSDTGYGMNDDVLQRIFDPFYSTKFFGTGLGLAAVLGILRGHRGTIRVTSRPGEGTQIDALFPAARK